MSVELTDVDRALLQAAQNHKPIEMMVALANGANINAVDPSNGRTALHYAATDMVPYCLFVLIYEQTHYPQLLESIREDTELNVIEVDLAVRQAQARLNPLILDHDHLFASELVDFPENDECVSTDPTVPIRANNYFFIKHVEEDALTARGLSPELRNIMSYSLEERIEQLAGFGLGEKPKSPGF